MVQRIDANFNELHGSWTALFVQPKFVSLVLAKLMPREVLFCTVLGILRWDETSFEFLEPSLIVLLQSRFCSGSAGLMQISKSYVLVLGKHTVVLAKWCRRCEVLFRTWNSGVA